MSAIDLRAFRNTIGLFATSATVITTSATVITANADGETHGMTANSVTSMLLDPLLVLVCVDWQAQMCSMITKAGRFAINITRGVGGWRSYYCIGHMDVVAQAHQQRPPLIYFAVRYRRLEKEQPGEVKFNGTSFRQNVIPFE